MWWTVSSCMMLRLHVWRSMCREQHKNDKICTLTLLMPRLRNEVATMAAVPHSARMLPHIRARPGVN